MEKMRRLVIECYTQSPISKNETLRETPQFGDDDKLEDIFDSLIYVQLIIYLEKVLNIKIPDEDCNDLLTIRHFHEYVENRFPGKLNQY